MTPCDQCDRERLQQLFNETLPDDLASSVADHVAECAHCQHELESLAGARNWWIEAGSRLSRSSAEVPSLRMDGMGASNHRPNEPRANGTVNGTAGPSDSIRFAATNWHEESSDEAYASDFAVDFLDPSEDSAALGRLGDYEIIEVIGRGGMGIVLKGFQKELHRFVAVKVLAPHLATSGAARRRFAREAQATAAVVNPHVMAIHSVHANSKLPYLVMPFVECESLQQRLDRLGPLDVKDILRIGMQGARGLAAAHAQGLVHRDVKPANILLEANVDRVMLTDFGLARAVDDATLTRTGIIAGTPQYMSPEQANGDAVDHRSDLFSLGSVLYAMCTARPPFRAETTFGILRRIRETAPRPIREINPDIPEWLERIVFQLLSKNSAERISTANEVAQVLEKCLAHVQQPTIVPLPGEWGATPARSGSDSDRSPRTNGLRWRRVKFLAPVIALMAAMTIWRQIHTPTDSSPSWDNDVEKQEVRSDAKPVDDLVPEQLFEWNKIQTDLSESDSFLNQLESRLQSDMEQEPPGTP